MSTLTPSGFSRTDLATIRDQIIASMTTIYGEGIDLSNDSPDGQMVQIFANSLYAADGLVQNVYNSLRPTNGYGTGLSQLVQLNGLVRKEATSTNGYITLYGSPSTTIPSGSLVKDKNLTYQYSTTENASITSNGSGTVFVRCLTTGPITVGPGTVNTILTPVPGWTSITNPTAFTPGTASETDADLRYRRNLSTGFPAVSTIDAIVSGLLALIGVKRCKVYENTTLKQINAVVYGGNDNDIANVLWIQKGFGAYIGANYVYITDIQGFPHVVAFDRPTIVQLATQVSFTQIPGLYNTSTPKLISDAIISYINNFDISQPVRFWEFSSIINDAVRAVANNGVLLNSIQISRLGNPLGMSDIILGSKEIIQAISANINIIVT